MATYAWEKATGAKGGKKVKSAGTVIFNPREDQACDFPHFTKSRDNTMSEETAVTLSSKLGFEALLPAQAQCFNGIYKSRDVILHSRTGSGKTLAYALPIIERRLEKEVNAPKDGPFLVIFVFSTELAMQTKSVLKSVYGKRIKVVVPALEEIEAGESYDVLIGTIASLDIALRGKRRGAKGAQAQAADSDEALAAAAAAAAANAEGADEASEDDSSSDEEDDDGEESEESSGEESGDEAEGDEKKGDKKSGKKDDKRKKPHFHRRRKKRNPQYDRETPALKSDCIRSIVIDEVDTTLGPKYSHLGRKMKHLLKYIRHHNGSINYKLQRDFRAHHYVLVGATIPNWVIKAGFLGNKKYYYRLIVAGSSKLPSGISCFAANVPANSRAEYAVKAVAEDTVNDRAVVFASQHSIDSLEAVFNAAIRGAKSGTHLSKLIVRSLSGSKDEMERIQCMQEFNSGTANVLLCTDTAARGLDFSDVKLVLMTTLPKHTMAAEAFVHRAGRTARVNKEGKCVALFDASLKEDVAAIKAIEAVTHIQFKRLAVGGAQSDAITLQLRVRNSFAYGASASENVPSPTDVLEKSLGTDFSLVKQVEEVDKMTILFKVPATSSHVVKKKLWKYDLKEMTATEGSAATSTKTAEASDANVGQKRRRK